MRLRGLLRRGPVPGPDTLFEIGSITKVLTGVLLADMHLRGEVALTDPLSRHLPGSGPAWPGAEPTLLDLATHRSGLPNMPRPLALKSAVFVAGIGSRDPWAGADAPRFARLLRDERVKPPRAGQFAYSSLGFALLGDALAAAAGRPYEDLLRERVLDPLGMHATALRPSAPVLAGHSPRGAPRPPLTAVVHRTGRAALMYRGHGALSVGLPRARASRPRPRTVPRALRRPTPSTGSSLTLGGVAHPAGLRS